VGPLKAKPRLWVAAVLVMTLALIAPRAFGVDAASASGSGGVARLPVTFQVVNTDTSGMPCPVDDALYKIRGHLTGPTSVLARRQPGAVTVYLAGLDFGEWNWDFTAVPGYDYASELAKSGHVSLTIDELGYGSSGHPDNGNLTCIGAQADITHQIVGDLRSGRYAVGDGPGLKFSRVLLAGHDIGGEIAAIEAYSFADIDGLIQMDWADQGHTQFIVQRNVTAGWQWCTVGPGQTPELTSYVHFATEEDWHTWAFFNADPAVRDATDALRMANPCGVIRSLAPTVVVDNPSSLKGAIPGVDPGTSPVSRLSEIKVPVLDVFGLQDTQIWTHQGEAEQQSNFSSMDKTTSFVPDTGHFPMFERGAPTFRDVVSSWLKTHQA